MGTSSEHSKNFDTLEDGCWYLTRDGNEILKVSKTEHPNLFAASDSNSYCYANGRCSVSDTAHPKDLVTKVEPPIVSKQKRKVLTKRWKWYVIPKIGEPAVLTKHLSEEELFGVFGKNIPRLEKIEMTLETTETVVEE